MPDKHSPQHHFKPGLSATVEKAVAAEWTLAAYDPRWPDVLSTPAMIGLMEVAASLALEPELPHGFITVGTRIEVDHLRAVRRGAKIEASARLVGYQGRFMVFEVEARSAEHVIGRGRVFRALVEPKSFYAKASALLESSKDDR